jgi:hypothetical protein
MPREIGARDPLVVPDGLEGEIRHPPSPGVVGRDRRLRQCTVLHGVFRSGGAAGRRRIWTLVTEIASGFPEMIDCASFRRGSGP